MDGWVYGGMDGWVYGGMDGVMEGWMDGWMGVWRDGWMGLWRDGWVYGGMDGCVEELVDVDSRTRGPGRCTLFEGIGSTGAASTAAASFYRGRLVRSRGETRRAPKCRGRCLVIAQDPEPAGFPGS